MRRVVPVTVLSTVLCAVVLSGCATPVKAGAAAVVGDERVSTSSVEATTTSVREPGSRRGSR